MRCQEKQHASGTVRSTSIGRSAFVCTGGAKSELGKGGGGYVEDDVS